MDQLIKRYTECVYSGGQDVGYVRLDDILRYDQANNSWTNVGKMTTGRAYYHVVTTIANVSDICP